MQRLKKKADLNLRLFGSNTEVVLFLREPIDWLKSVYLQALHQGFVRPPQAFFVRGDYYSQIARGLHPGDFSLFNLDSFCYRDLVDAYRSRFNHVSVFRFESLRDPSKLISDLGFDVTENFKNKDWLVGNKIANRGYSSI